MGIAAVDKEELALLAGQLVRIRAVRPRKPPVVLAHHLDPLRPEEPIGWVDPNLVPFESSLFFLHFDSADHSRPDRARIATAAPSDTSPRAWLAVDPKTGVISLTSCEHGAAVFDVRKSSSSRDSAFSLQCNCTAGRYLSVHADTMRARICSNYVAASESFLFNTVPLPPTLTNEQDPPHDCTMAVAYNTTRSTPIRIQSRARGWYLSSKPGTPLASAESKDSGWDSFTLDYDSATRSARIRDSRGLYLGFSSDLTELVAATDTLAEESGDEGPSQRAPHPERFMVYPTGHDDTVVFRSRKGYLSARRGGRIVLNKDTLPRTGEEFYLRVALPSMMDHSTPRLRLRVLEGGARQVEASILVPARAAVAYEVLCDYDGFHEFIKDASESKILDKKSDTELTVLMVQCHTFLVLTIPMTMVLDVKETPETRSVKMNLKRGLGVKEYRGIWQAVERADGRCLIRCSLVATTSVPAPGCLMDGLMSHATHATMEQLRVECIRRSTVEKHGTQGTKAKGTVVGR